jgi:multiple sugar transport system substrate-binding protein
MPLLMALALSTSGCGLGLATPTPTPEPAKLRFAFRKNIADYTALANQFHQVHPDVAVDLVALDTEGGELRAIDGRDVDVVRWSQDYLTPERVQQTLPVDEIILADDGFPRGDMLKGTMEALQRQGVQWGIPAGLDFVVAYYDAQRFKIAQATPPTPDWTLDDLLAAAIAVNHTEGLSSQADFAYGFCSDPESGDPAYFAYLFGGRLFDRMPDPSRPTLNDPANVKAIQWYADLRLKYGVIPDSDEIGKFFPHGRLGEAIVRSKCGLWFGVYSDRGGQAWGYEWQGEGVMLPLPRARAPFGVIYVDGYYILAQSEHRREAWEWVRFLLDHQEAAGLMLPPLQSQARSTQYADRVGKDVAAVARQLPAEAIIMPTDPDPAMGRVMELYLEAVARVIKGDVDAETALNEAQDQAEALFGARE